MSKLIDIAKECGADPLESCIKGEGVFVTPDQLRATVEQVAGPLMKSIHNLSAVVRIQNGNKHEDINCLLGIADKHVSDYRAIMGDKK